MNYTEMSDFEINRLVAMCIEGVAANDDGSPKYAVDCFLRGDDDSVDVMWCGFDELSPFNPCNSWADAGPIIQKNRIMLNPYCADELWKAEHEVMNDGFMSTYAVNYDKNPLRAAMIVFLMMQDKK